MLAFWAIVAVFVVITLALLLPPLLKSREVKGVVARKDLTITVYKDQFDELENDLKNNTITEEQYKKAKIDLEKNLLEDVDKAEKQDELKVDVSQTSNKIVAAFIVIFVPVISVSLYSLWGAGVEGIAPETIPEETRLAQQQHNQQESMEAMLQQLEDRLKVDPNDGESWFMLARSYAFLQRFDDSVAAYKKTLQLGGDQSAEVLSSYADVLAMAAGRRLTDEAIAVLQKATEINPSHIKSLWLLGTAAHQNQDYNTSLKYWERLYSLLEPGSDDQNQMVDTINQTRNQLGMPPFEVTKVIPATPADQQVSDVRIQGTVSLSDEMNAKVDDSDTVFVFARAASGPRMPLAIIRKQVKDMPFDFTLDDSLAMNPSMKLSSVSQVVVSARISKTGDAMPQAGDLQGASSVLSVGTRDPIALVIDSVVQ